jgi:hypothetical protein
LVDATAHVHTLYSDFEYVMDHIIYMKCDVDISALERIYNFSYHRVVISECSPLFGVGRYIIVGRWQR